MNRRLHLIMALSLAMTGTECLAEEFNYTFTQTVYTSAGTQSLNGVNWTLATDAGYYGYTSSKGQQIGSGNNPGKTVTLSTTGIQGKVSQIDVTTSGASNYVGVLHVTVGGNAFGQDYNVTTTSTTATFVGSASGEIKLNYTQTSSKALYIQAIRVVYTPGENTVPDTLEIPLVEGIAAFNSLPVGTEAQLYFSDESDARITYVYGKNAYIRDNTGSLCLYGFTKQPAMAYNQHIAGYITGKRAAVGNMPVMTATERTNTQLLAIAEPVTENNVEPVVITAAQWAAHYADWVTIKDVTMQDSINGSDSSGNIKVVNTFRTSQYTTPVTGNNYDLSGIVNSTASDGDRLSPIYNITRSRVGNPTWLINGEYLPIVVSTGILTVTTSVPEGRTVVYDLSGRRINPSHLGKGIYIVNGRKYVK